MDWIKIKVLHFLYIFRMFKDKSLKYVIDSYYGLSNEVSRQEDKQSGIINHFIKLSHNVTPVIDNILIGNACNSSSYYELQENKVQTIINVTEEIPNYFEGYHDYFKAPIRDTSEDSLQPYFHKILNYIHQQQEKYPDNNILIHCYMGSSRSAAIVVLYLVDTHNYQLQDAIQFLKEKRDIVNINVNFVQNLQQFINEKSESVNVTNSVHIEVPLE